MPLRSKAMEQQADSPDSSMSTAAAPAVLPSENGSPDKEVSTSSSSTKQQLLRDRKLTFKRERDQKKAGSQKHVSPLLRLKRHC